MGLGLCGVKGSRAVESRVLGNEFSTSRHWLLKAGTSGTMNKSMYGRDARAT